MKLHVDTSKEVECPLEDAFVETVVCETLSRSGFDFLDTKQGVGVSVAWVAPETIQKLNKTYRNKDKVTDVLSFPEYINKDDMQNSAGESVFLGELIVCYDYIKTAAEEDEVSLEREAAYIISHGILHLLGFEHSEDMFGRQDAVCDAVAG